MNQHSNGKQLSTEPTPALIYLPNGQAVPLAPNGPVAVAAQSDPRTPEKAIYFAALPDGRLVDLIQEPSDEAKLSFVVFKDGQFDVQRTIKHGGRMFVPPRLDPSLARAVRFPARPQGNPTVRGILDELTKVFTSYLTLRRRAAFLSAAYVLATWFADCLPLAPTLLVSGIPGARQETFFRLLQILCRRGLRIADITPVSLFRLASGIKPTLLTESDLPRPVERLLRKGNKLGVFSIRSGQAFEFGLPLVMHTRFPDANLASAMTTIAIELPCSTREPSSLAAVDMEDLAQRFVPQLLMFRLQNYFRVKDLAASCHLDHASAGPLLAQALGAAMLGDTRGQKKLIRALSDRELDFQLDRELEPEWLVARALFRFCHKPLAQTIFVGHLTIYVNHFQDVFHEPRSSAKRVGLILKSLGFRTRRLGSDGRGLVLTGRLKRQIHMLALQLGITRGHITNSNAIEAGYCGRPCLLCDKHGLGTAEDGKPLKSQALSTRGAKHWRRPLLDEETQDPAG